MTSLTPEKGARLRRLNDSLIWRLLKYGMRRQGKFYAIGMIAMLVVAGTSALTAWSMQAIVDTMTAPENRAQVATVSLMVVGLFCAKGLATYIQTVSMAKAGNGIIAQQQKLVYGKLVQQGVDFFNLRESSDLLMRVTQGAQAARGLIDLLVTSMVRDLLTMIGLIAVMFYQQPVLSAVSLVVGPIALIGIRIILRSVQSIMQRQLASLSEILKVLQETSNGIRVIKIFSLEGVMQKRMDRAIREVEKRANSVIRLEAVTSPLMETLSGLAIAGVVWLSALNLSANEATTPGQLMSFITALLMAYEPAKRLSRMRVSMESMMVGVQMMFDLLDQRESITESRDAKQLEISSGRMVFENVGFSYDGKETVLHDVSMEFEGGRTTALVGESGSGKSTVLNLAMRLYDPTGGRILIDGTNIRDVSFESLRRSMSFVGQDTFLFSASVIENIRCSKPEATDEEVYAAAQAAHAHDFILGLPQGYQTQVGENGTFLSGGQRQRLAIARAFLRRANILLLDEATSALDSRSEAFVKEGLARISKNTTTIVIAHRLSTILRADRVYVMGGGRILEWGTAEELLAGNGAFRKLYDQQFGDMMVTKSDP
ncbi:ABC transporter ATP-binding protein [Paenirhodobacter populi]|uniref:ABC transporter ATP-binding protein n=1 Tax=Paenirhodobacter populi TaxID=2306993 RepID=UPI000FE31D28|nr:ABC transporter ATP-binding protein [Sinirhodobacter populi]RWR04676.1 ABC transporter ATP-binding protein [Sinirhodobacter populi]